MSVQLNGLIENTLSVPVDDGQVLYLVSGTAIYQIDGSGTNWNRDNISFLVGPRIRPDEFVASKVTASLASIVAFPYRPGGPPEAMGEFSGTGGGSVYDGGVTVSVYGSGPVHIETLGWAVDDALAAYDPAEVRVRVTANLAVLGLARNQRLGFQVNILAKRPQPVLTLTIDPPANTVMWGVKHPFTVYAEDGYSGASVPGKVRIDTDPQEFNTGTPFDYTFQGVDHQVTVTAPGYPDTSLHYTLLPRGLSGKSDPHPPPLGQEVPSVVIRAYDLDSGVEVTGGTATIQNPNAPPDSYPTGQSFRYTFHRGAIHRRVLYPSGTVSAGGYEDGSIDFGFPEVVE